MNVLPQQLFIWCMASIYLFAFASLYFQVPGLYGVNGILPSHLQLKGFCEDGQRKCGEWSSYGECKKNPDWMKKNCQLSCAICKEGEELSLVSKFNKKVTLLWLAPYFHLNVSSAMELCCVAGTLLSITALIFQRMQNRISYVTLWLLYFSLYEVGQTFLWFQWDILLLETGFLAIFLVPNCPNKDLKPRMHRDLIFWLLKWLLFRLMFASGVVKLTSLCPTWWNLTALNWHYESQCIPTPLAWYAHQLPEWFQKLSVVATYVIEICVPFLFFAPLRSLRLFSFCAQVLLQVAILLTGNYNFFNLLTIVLCISLLDESVDRISTSEKPFRFVRIVKPVLCLFIFLSMFYWTKRLFNLQFGENLSIKSEIAFTKEEFFEAVGISTQVAIVVASFSFAALILESLYKSIFHKGSLFRRGLYTTKTLLFVPISTWFFLTSLVPFTEVDQGTQDNLWPIIHQFHSSSRYFHVSNSYGLFRRMTGVGGRPELVIEASNNLDGGWQEISFHYKPGNLKRAPSIVAPHQPRLDWQMWFAALGSYQHNPWFIHLVYKLLIGNKEVYALLAPSRVNKKPWKFIRSTLYTYHYTLLPPKTTGVSDAINKTRKMKSWWRREFSREYTPPLSKDEPSLRKYITDMGWNLEDEVMKIQPGVWNYTLDLLRSAARNSDPTSIILQLFCFSLITKIILRYYY